MSASRCRRSTSTRPPRPCSSSRGSARPTRTRSRRSPNHGSNRCFISAERRHRRRPEDGTEDGARRVISAERRHRRRPEDGGRRAVMRFVDEFRDADKAHALAAKITALCEPGRQYKLMEVCGGHTHTIYKHGLEDYLPEQITLVHGPGCPVCVIPMGRVDDAIALAAEPDVIMTSFGDMMRVPGSNGSFFDAKARGTD